MRVALAQVDPTVGDLDGNARRTLAAAREAHGRGATLVVFPELALAGYCRSPMLHPHAGGAGRGGRPSDRHVAPPGRGSQHRSPGTDGAGLLRAVRSWRRPGSSSRRLNPRNGSSPEQTSRPLISTPTAPARRLSARRDCHRFIWGAGSGQRAARLPCGDDEDSIMIDEEGRPRWHTPNSRPTLPAAPTR
ncbi:MAG: hypothetical protein JXB32_19525 [Deltaproteobacteria bacterium]|nr:hypothetical protein [Deltaproteobacteria bacterium]